MKATFLANAFPKTGIEALYFASVAGLHLILRSSAASLCGIAKRKENAMSNSKQTDTPRVLGRAGARDLSTEEMARVAGGQNRTFVFTHVILDDVTHD